MKFIIKPAIIAAIVFSISSCKKSESTETSGKIDNKEIAEAVIKKEIKPENLQQSTFKIEGMTCAIGCAKTIEEELNKQPDVKEAKVDFDKKTATISFDKSSLNQNEIVKIVQSLADGNTYKVSDFK